MVTEKDGSVLDSEDVMPVEEFDVSLKFDGVSIDELVMRYDQMEAKIEALIGGVINEKRELTADDMSLVLDRLRQYYKSFNVIGAKIKALQPDRELRNPFTPEAMKLIFSR